MQAITRNIFRTTIGAAVCALAMQAGWAQGPAMDNSMQASDPPRWYQEDMTPSAHFQTLKKEAGAALKEAQIECKKAERAARAACMREARSIFDHDMAAARQQTGIRGR